MNKWMNEKKQTSMQLNEKLQLSQLFLVIIVRVNKSIQFKSIIQVIAADSISIEREINVTSNFLS